MNHTRLAFFVLVILFGVANCGRPQVCPPGKSEPCACPGGSQGAQTCDSDGTRWLVCVCPSSEKTVPDVVTPPAENKTETTRPELIIEPIPKTDFSDAGEKTTLPDLNNSEKNKPDQNNPAEKTPENIMEKTTEIPVSEKNENNNSDQNTRPEPTKEPAIELPPETKPDQVNMDNIQPELTKETPPEPQMEKTADTTPCQFKASQIVQLQPSTHLQIAGSLVWNGKEYATSYIDQKSGTNQVYFLRFDKSGKAIGQSTIVAKGINHQNIVRMIWTGSEYLIGWLETAPRTGGGNTNILKVIRVSSAGLPQGNAVTIVSGNPISHALAWSGTSYGVTWILNDVVYLMVLSPTLSSKSTAINITRASGFPSNYSPSYGVTGANNGFAFVYNDVGIGTVKIKWMWVKADGTKSTPTDIATGAYIGHFALRWNGAGYGVMWTENDPTASRFLRYIYVSSSGVPATTRVYNVHTETTPSPRIYYPSMHWDGSLFTVIFLRGTSSLDYIMHNQFSPSLQQNIKAVRASPPINGISPLHSAWNGKETGVVWVDETKAPRQLFFTQVFCQ